MFLQRLRRVIGGVFLAAIGYIACRSAFAECQGIEQAAGFAFPAVALADICLTTFIVGFCSSRFTPSHVIFGLAQFAAVITVYVPLRGEGILLIIFGMAVIIGWICFMTYFAGQICALGNQAPHKA